MTLPQHIIHKLGELGISTEPNTNIENWNPIPVLDHEEQQKLSGLTILASHEQLIEQGFGVVQEVFTIKSDELIFEISGPKPSLDWSKIFCLKSIL